VPQRRSWWAWRLCEANHELIAVWVADDLTGVTITELLERRGVTLPSRTMQRDVVQVFGRRRSRRPTVRVVDGEPGDELQVDFGRMGLLTDAVTGRRRVVHASVFSACFSRHCFVWLSSRRPRQR
jgi:transposase